MSSLPPNTTPPAVPFNSLQFTNNSAEESITLRPGPHSYSEALKVPRKSTIVTTSVARDIHVNEFNKKFIRGTAHIHKFPGEKAHNLKDYVSMHMKQEHSDSVVVIGGGNDLGSNKTILEIANHLIEAGIEGRNLGAAKICISSILPRADFHQQIKRHQLNKLLGELCLANGFEYIDNSNIRLDTHILSDGVHLKISGTELLQSNILR